MPRNNNNFWLASWIANFDKNHQPPAPPNPCPTIAFNTVAKAEYKSEAESAIQLQFANHAWLTSMTLNLIFVNTQPQISASAAKLAETAQKITDAIRVFYIPANATVTDNVQTALTNHISTASAYAGAVKQYGLSSSEASTAQTNFTNQATELATALTALDCSVDYAHMLEHWQTHNQCVIDIVALVYNGVDDPVTYPNNFNLAMDTILEYVTENDHMAMQIADAVATHHYR